MSTVEKKMLNNLAPDLYSTRQILHSSYYNNKNYNNTRRTRVILLTCCARHNKLFVQLDTDMQLKIIRQIERSCHNQTSFIANARDVPRNWENPMFVNIYNIIAYKIQKNLYIPGVENSYLIKNIINGNILAKDVGSMESKQLQPSKSQVIHNEIEKRKQQKVKKKYSMQYLCTKCGGRKTSELEFQSRSLDEGSTLIITCEMDNCSNKWTISS